MIFIRFIGSETAVREWRDIQASCFTSFNVKIHSFHRNCQGSLSCVCVCSASNLLVGKASSPLSLSAGMKTLQRLCPPAKLIEPAFGICCSHSISIQAGAGKLQSSPMGTPSYGNFPAHLQWRRMSIFWYILDKHLLVILIQKLEILGLLHVDSFQQLTQQQFIPVPMINFAWLEVVFDLDLESGLDL